MKINHKHFQSLLETPNLALNKLQPENNIFSWIVVFPILAHQQYSRKLSVIELQIDKCLRNTGLTKLQFFTSVSHWNLNLINCKVTISIVTNCEVTKFAKVNVDITPQSTFWKWVFNKKWFYNLNHQSCIGRPPINHYPNSTKIYTPL